MADFLPEVLTFPDFQADVNEEVVLGNVSRALSSARAVGGLLSVSKWWIRRSPVGGVEAKVAVIYREFPVGIIELSPVDGRPLPCGFYPRIPELVATEDMLSESVKLLSGGLRVVEAVEYREREMSFAVPIAFKTLMVSHLNIYYDGVHVLPDYLIMQEMKLFEV